MPGILPMKVIKVGGNSQTRIAQACDRCRSKKIRCDGIRPSCSQCLNVGFECKTSDKLSRRAFPRGYTESLEERVRQLEAEIRELKDLLDEKDEKIDMLSRIHSHSPQSMSASRKSLSLSPGPASPKEEVDKEDLFKIQQSPLLLEDGSADSYFVGTSSGRTLIDAFNRRIQESGRTFPAIKPEGFLDSETNLPPSTYREDPVCWKAPPRMVSDQMINIFFQEWAPLFPVLHRPTFLGLYEEYVNSPDTMTDRKSLAQLNLVFGIAALSSDSADKAHLDSFEAQWQAALDSFLNDSSMATMQCLVLAQMYCVQKADYARLLKYKGIAISLSYRLGLHQSQKRFALGALTGETRKKVFWTLYTLDCFTAAQLGLPKHLKEEDVHCEYPVDADDEYVTEKGFLPSLPGEFTKLSSALALFRVSRIIAKILTENYQASPTYDISLRKLTAQSDELEEWSNSLPTHLKLQFAQDKPSTNVISSRSPILSMVYHYIRTLIWRPAVCANLGSKGSAAVVALAASCKHIIQIIQLLEERTLSFSLCMNRNRLLVVSGFGLMFQSLEVDQDGKLVKDNQKLMAVINNFLDRSAAPGAAAFRRVAKCMTARPEQRAAPKSPSNAPSTATPQDAIRSTQKHLKAIASRFSPQRHQSQESVQDMARRATLPNLQHSNQSGISIHSVNSEPGARSEPTLSPVAHRASLGALPANKVRRPSGTGSIPNLDYLSFGVDPTTVGAYTINPPAPNGKTDSNEWERLLSGIDNGTTNIYDSIYGGPPMDALNDVPPLSAAAEANLAWSPSMWVGPTDQPPPQSVLSFSDESLTSGSDEYACDFGSNSSDTYRGLVIPDLSPSGTAGMVSLDGNFGL